VYVDADVRIGGGGLARCGQKRTRGEGVKIHQIFADVLYGQSHAEFMEGVYNGGPTFNRLWTEVHENLGESREAFAV